MTVAVNRRKYERWRDIDVPRLDHQDDDRHAFIRRCASFWTSQEPTKSEGTQEPTKSEGTQEPTKTEGTQEPTKSEGTNQGWDGGFSLPFFESPRAYRHSRYLSRSRNGGRQHTAKRSLYPSKP